MERRRDGETEREMEGGGKRKLKIGTREEREKWREEETDGGGREDVRNEVRARGEEGVQET